MGFDLISKEKIGEIADKLAGQFKPQQILLVGSYARESATEHSDIDLIIIKDSTLPRHERSTDMYKILRGMKIPIDIVVFTRSEFEEAKKDKYSFVYGSIKNARILYEEKR